MLDGSGTVRLGQGELVDMIDRCARAELNVCLHAIGERARFGELSDALQPHRRAWSKWRPRIEHAQCVHPRTRSASHPSASSRPMQPIHRFDRELADAEWPSVTANAYAWAALQRAGARLAFGSDAAGGKRADPLLGHRRRDRLATAPHWHPTGRGPTPLVASVSI